MILQQHLQNMLPALMQLPQHAVAGMNARALQRKELNGIDSVQ
jgi:hypothetical protein